MENNIEKLIKFKKIKEIDIVKSCDISRCTLYKIKKGITTPSLINAYKISKALNEPIEKVFELENQTTV